MSVLLLKNKKWQQPPHLANNISALSQGTYSLKVGAAQVKFVKQ
jgi:hypothetical protein